MVLIIGNAYLHICLYPAKQLNQYVIHTGPLMAFRTHRIGFSADQNLAIALNGLKG